MQAIMNLATREQLKRSWAFAATQHRDKRLVTTRNRAVITAVSKEARNFGIQAGMRVREAKELMPGLRVLMYGGGNYAKSR